MIIGITGKIGSGKSTAANYLVSKGFTEYSMAGPLKEIGKIFGFTHDQLYGTQEQKLQIHSHWGVSSREFLQKMGTEMFREHLPKVLPDMKIPTTIWAELFRVKYLQEPKKYVISDVRFLDEAKVIKELGGIIIRVIRDHNSGSESLHISEIEQEKIEADYILNKNNLSIEESNSILQKFLDNFL